MCSVELDEVGGGVLQLLFYEGCKGLGLVRVVWETCAVFGVIEVVGGEGRFWWWSAGFSWVKRIGEGRTGRSVDSCYLGRRLEPQMLPILLACRCMMGVLRLGKSRCRREGLRKPLRPSRRDRGHLCRLEALKDGDLSCSS